MSSDWQQALTYAVLGRGIPGAQTSAPDLDAIIAVVSEHRAEAMTAHQAAQEAETAWPLPLPAQLADGLPSVAQYLAARQRVVEALDLAPHLPRAQRRPDADERRLLADRPPHFGRVG